MRKPNKKDLAAALHAMRLYLGTCEDLCGRAADEAKMLARAERLCNKLAKQTGRTPGRAWNEVLCEARRLGAVTPILGQDM